MPSGPVEILTVAFPGNHFSGKVIPELARLVEAGTISIIDAVLAVKDAAGSVSFVEFDSLDAGSNFRPLETIIERVEGLISEDDIDQLVERLEPDSSEAILVFEHTWAKPLRAAVDSSGGFLQDSIRIPGPVVDEVRAAIAELA